MSFSFLAGNRSFGVGNLDLLILSHFQSSLIGQLSVLLFWKKASKQCVEQFGCSRILKLLEQQGLTSLAHVPWFCVC